MIITISIYIFFSLLDLFCFALFNLHVIKHSSFAVVLWRKKKVLSSFPLSTSLLLVLLSLRYAWRKWNFPFFYFSRGWVGGVEDETLILSLSRVLKRSADHITVLFFLKKRERGEPMWMSIYSVFLSNCDKFFFQQLQLRYTLPQF